MIHYLDMKYNKETNRYLSDKGIMQYFQILENIVIKGIIHPVTEYYTLTAIKWFLPGFYKVHFFKFNKIYILSKKTFFLISYYHMMQISFNISEKYYY